MPNRGEKSKFHEWANTALATLALITAIASAIFAHEANALHGEAISVAVRPNSSCEMNYDAVGAEPYLDLCWDVWLANLSEDKTVVSDLTIADEDGLSWTSSNGRLHYLSDGKFTTRTDETVQMPLSLDGGTAVELIAWKQIHPSPKMIEILRNLNPSGKGAVNQDDLFQSMLDSGYFASKKGHEELVTVCDYMQDVDSKGKCRKHFKIEVSTVRGGTYDENTSMPEKWR